MASKKISHIAIVVEDIDDALTFWQEALDLKLEKITDVPEQEAMVAFLPLGDSEIELVQPTTQKSGLARYLQKRGPGLHHICLEVPNIQQSLERLRTHQVQLIDDEPRIAADGKRYAFIHPKSTFGVLIELYELPK
jgi:methylmalonyl-CoA/ethylmalonyl-CoA epimerase